jgi:hypothetical protein
MPRCRRRRKKNVLRVYTSAMIAWDQKTGERPRASAAR